MRPHFTPHLPTRQPFFPHSEGKRTPFAPAPPGATRCAKRHGCTARFIAASIEHLFDASRRSIVVFMRTTTASLPSAPPRAERPHLRLVPSRATCRPAPVHQRLAALLSGLLSGFVLAALAAVWGGGSPRVALIVAAACAVFLAGVLAYARAVTVRAQRARRHRAARVPESDAVTSTQLARAA
jgi:hypothetical protein